MSPVHIDVYVNERPIHSWHIGRIMGGTGKDDINPYLIVRGPINERVDWSDDSSVEFMHRYGDGIDVCIQRGLQAALGDVSTIPVLSPAWEGSKRKGTK